MKETLNFVAQFVEFFVVPPFFLAVLRRWNDDFDLAFLQRLNNSVGIVRFVCQARISVNEVDKFDCYDRIMHLPLRKKKLQGSSAGIR